MEILDEHGKMDWIDPLGVPERGAERPEFTAGGDCFGGKSSGNQCCRSDRSPSSAPSSDSNCKRLGGRGHST
jgi:hypothetical protein